MLFYEASDTLKTALARTRLARGTGPDGRVYLAHRKELWGVDRVDVALQEPSGRRKELPEGAPGDIRWRPFSEYFPDGTRRT